MTKVPLVIACPYCRSPLGETDPACPRCQFDLPRTRALLGPVPRLVHPTLTDLTQTLSPADERSIHKSAAAFARRFPQCKLFIVLKEFAPQFPLAVHLFWLFNSAGLSAEINKAGRNRDILLGIDPVHSLSGLIVGYGLEPFLPATALERVLECATPDFHGERFTAGIKVLIAQLSELMEGICHGLPNMVGIEPNLIVQPSPRDY